MYGCEKCEKCECRIKQFTVNQNKTKKHTQIHTARIRHDEIIVCSSADNTFRIKYFIFLNACAVRVRKTEGGWMENQFKIRFIKNGNNPLWMESIPLGCLFRRNWDDRINAHGHTEKKKEKTTTFCSGTNEAFWFLPIIHFY